MKSRVKLIEDSSSPLIEFWPPLPLIIDSVNGKESNVNTCGKDLYCADIDFSRLEAELPLLGGLVK